MKKAQLPKMSSLVDENCVFGKVDENDHIRQFELNEFK